MSELKVLEIGPGPKPGAAFLWPEADIVTLDADPQWGADHISDCRQIPEELQGQFDHLLASHVLEHVPWFAATPTVEHWSECLKPGGALHIVVPSLEWAARQILSEKPSPAALPHLYAGQDTPWNVHLGGFTMRLLRAIFEKAGLQVKRARTGPYKVMVLGKAYEAEQHYVMGRRKDEG